MQKTVKTLHSLQDLRPEMVIKRKRVRFHRPTGVPVEESVEFRIIQKRREIAAWDKAHGLEVRNSKRVLRYRLFGQWYHKPLSERKSLEDAGIQVEEVVIYL